MANQFKGGRPVVPSPPTFALNWIDKHLGKGYRSRVSESSLLSDGDDGDEKRM